MLQRDTHARTMVWQVQHQNAMSKLLLLMFVLLLLRDRLLNTAVVENVGGGFNGNHFVVPIEPICIVFSIVFLLEWCFRLILRHLLGGTTPC